MLILFLLRGQECRGKGGVQGPRVGKGGIVGCCVVRGWLFDWYGSTRRKDLCAGEIGQDDSGEESRKRERLRVQTLMNSLTTGTPILVPLTPSLYVPGKLASTDVVFVDIGTGFYVEKVRQTLG